MGRLTNAMGITNPVQLGPDLRRIRLHPGYCDTMVKLLPII